MNDRDKVVSRLQIIRTWAEVGKNYDGIQGDGCLRDIVDWIDDALELLKAQEPRVLTLEELQVWQEAIWFEEHDDEPFIALISNYDPTNAELSVVDVDAYRRETNHDLRIYNKWWRCWTSRPTDEQMEAVPWES